MPKNNKNIATFNFSENSIREDGLFSTLKRGMSKKLFKKKNEVLAESQSSYRLATRQGENEVQSRGARDRRALTGEAENASCRKVIVGDAGMNPIRDECASDAGRSRSNNSRVMRTNFGDTTAEIFREHSDSLAKLEDPYFISNSPIKNSKEDNLEGNSTTNTLQNIDDSFYPDYISINSAHSLNDIDSSSDDESKDNKKKGVSEVIEGTDVNIATTRPLPMIPLSDQEIFNHIYSSNFFNGIKLTITNPYVLDDSHDELAYKIFITLVLHFAPGRNDDAILKKLFKDFKNFLENLENPYQNIPIQNNGSDLLKSENFHGFFNSSESNSLVVKNTVSENPYMIMKGSVQKDLEHTHGNQSEQTLKI